VGSRQRQVPGRTQGSSGWAQLPQIVQAVPTHVTVPKSGVSYSAGVEGARIIKRADGRVRTTLPVPGAGLQCTTRLLLSGLITSPALFSPGIYLVEHGFDLVLLRSLRTE